VARHQEGPAAVRGLLVQVWENTLIPPHWDAAVTITVNFIITLIYMYMKTVINTVRTIPPITPAVITMQTAFTTGRVILTVITIWIATEGSTCFATLTMGMVMTGG
jgi:hypothetical protein